MASAEFGGGGDGDGSRRCNTAGQLEAIQQLNEKCQRSSHKKKESDQVGT